jgi:hypothetical protein
MRGFDGRGTTASAIIVGGGGVRPGGRENGNRGHDNEKQCLSEVWQ